MDRLDERYRKILQSLLIQFFKKENKNLSLSVSAIQDLMQISPDEAELYFNIFNYTAKFLEILKKSNIDAPSNPNPNTDKALDLSVNELISFSDFSVLSSKVPIVEKDFIKSEHLVRIKTKYPFLFRFVNGKWKCSSVGETIGKEFKSFSKMNMIPPKLVLEGMVINIAEES